MPVNENERERRRSLVKAHVAAENAHDIEAIMATFAPHAINRMNGDVSTTPDAVRQAHVLFGLSQQPGIFTALQVVHEVEHFSDEEIIYEGHFIGMHTGSAPGYPPPTGQELKLPYVVVYRFDPDGLLMSESASIELSQMITGSTAS